MHRVPLRRIVLCTLFLFITSAPHRIARAGGVPPNLVGPRLVRGWPILVGNGIFSTPAVHDLDGDGKDEIAI